MRTSTNAKTKPAAKLPSLYVGETVKVKDGGTIKSARVIEVAEREFCADFGDDDVRWVSTKNVVR